jgi:hypothetical protein
MITTTTGASTVSIRSSHRLPLLCQKAITRPKRYRGLTRREIEILFRARVLLEFVHIGVTSGSVNVMAGIYLRGDPERDK